MLFQQEALFEQELSKLITAGFFLISILFINIGSSDLAVPTLRLADILPFDEDS